MLAGAPLRGSFGTLLPSLPSPAGLRISRTIITGLIVNNTESSPRLSRPALATQYSLPNSQALGISAKASLSYPSEANTTDKFILTPVLNLPAAFGSAYVGETFSCTLCANNELEPSDTTKTISGVRIQGDMQTPSNPTGSPLDLSGFQQDGAQDAMVSPGPGESLQKILRFELKEEGNHVLAVTVTYTETSLGEGKAASGRVRTFRKLYQFVAQQLLSVRTKAGDMSQNEGSPRYLLEAQLENMGEAAVCLEVSFSFPEPCCISNNYSRRDSYISSISNPINTAGPNSAASALARCFLDPATSPDPRTLFRRFQTMRHNI